MKKPALFYLIIIAILWMLFQNQCHAQTKKETTPSDTISVQANAIQLERLNAIQEKINSSQKEFGELLELIFGVKIEKVEWWGFKNGKFLFILKNEKK